MTYNKGDVLQKQGEDDFHVEGMVGDIYLGYFISDVTGYKWSETYHKDELKDWKKKGERWKPKDEEEYFYVSQSVNVQKMSYMNSIDHHLYDAGNCFRTREEAEVAAGKVKALLLSLHE